MTTTGSLPLRLSHLAARGNRNGEIVRQLLDELEPVKEQIETAQQAIAAMESAADTYDQYDPADATTADQREFYRESRTDAWDEIQAEADSLATALDLLIEALGLEPMK